MEAYVGSTAASCLSCCAKRCALPTRHMYVCVPPLLPWLLSLKQAPCCTHPPQHFFCAHAFTQRATIVSLFCVIWGLAAVCCRSRLLVVPCYSFGAKAAALGHAVTATQPPTRTRVVCVAVVPPTLKAEHHTVVARCSSSKRGELVSCVWLGWPVSQLASRHWERALQGRFTSRQAVIVF